MELILKYIGEKLKELNPYLEEFAVNCIKVKGGEIVNFFGLEKADYRPSDIKGIAGYMRLDTLITYSDVRKRSSSCKDLKQAKVKFRTVIFSVNQSKRINAMSLEKKINADLVTMDFSGYSGKEDKITLSVTSSNLSDQENFKAEIGSYDVPADSIIVALNTELTFEYAPECNTECDIYETPQC
jgi:hypothetical protein